MTEGTEAAADALTGAIVASAVEPQAGAAALSQVDAARVTCRNCGATLTGPYCADCGQAARVHRTLPSVGHDILHSVVHFDGKLWRTIPELAIHPGRLTRRYVEGERAKFISPMALYLFTVFLMYAIFSFTGGTTLYTDLTQIPSMNQAGNRAAVERMQQSIDELRGRLGDTELSAGRRAELEEEIADLETAHAVLAVLASGDLARVDEIETAIAARRGDAAEEAVPPRTRSAFENNLSRRFNEVRDNPGLFTYKLRTNGYKYSWALVPLSIPFMWLLFCWRRDIRVYDHAVFVTYSISFMMLLLILASLLQTAGVSSGLVAVGLQIVPPVHMYRQLRGAYGLSRRGALLRLFFLLIAAAIVLIIFLTLLVLIGVLG
jgi:Protein of unknown function (DUF3667)